MISHTMNISEGGNTHSRRAVPFLAVQSDN